MPAADTIFIVGNLFTISTMDAKSQALAGGLFSTVTRVRCPPPPSFHHGSSPTYPFAETGLQISTAIGLAVTSAVTTTVTVNKSRDALPSPDTLLEGYHVAGWICFSTAVIGLPLNFYSLRGLGVIGGMSGMSEVENKKETTKSDGIAVAETSVFKEKNAVFEGK